MSLTPEMMPAWELLPIVKEQADRIEQLTSALRWIDEQRYVDRSTINQDNAFRKAVSLNEKLVKIMDTARTALEERT